MRKIDVETKRKIDSTLTDQLLHIGPIRDELMAYANRFLEKFHTDVYLLFGAIPIHQLCTISVKGGLGLENLEAQLSTHPPAILVWNDYYGDCDLNLIINKSHYPAGRPTGEVMAAVAQRIKILLAETINDTRYATLVRDLRAPLLQHPLYRCSQVEALAHIIDFVSQDLDLPVQLPVAVGGGLANVKTIAELFKDVIPGLVDICGKDLDTVFRAVTNAKSNDFIVYDDRHGNLLFVSDLNGVTSAWTDVDYSFFPYAPGRMDTLGFEVSELAIRQQRLRQIKEQDDLDYEVETLPYDIFKIANTPFVYTTQDTTNAVVDPRDNELVTPTEAYNLSMYANNLIDDFDLIRTALRFFGYSLQREDVQAAGPGAANYTVDVRSGTGKCEFVDVAIPRLGAPEWYYCQNRTYYITIPANPPPNTWAFKVCDFDYQVEENMNLLIELGCGLSHSKHKARKRIERLHKTWIRCNFRDVFPRTPHAPLPPHVPAPFNAPDSLVIALTNDYQNLYGIQHLPDWLYNDVFRALLLLYQRVDTYCGAAAPTLVDRDNVIEAAKGLGETGLIEIQCMADTVDGPDVATLRELLENGDIQVNWVMASYLLLKASRIADVIWFPRFGVFKVINPAPVTAAFQIATEGPPLAANDYVAVTWDARSPGPPLTFFTLPAADVIVPGAPNPPIFYGRNLTASERQLYNEIRNRLMRANNQMLRVSYGCMLNCLLRAAADAYLSDVL